MNVSDIEEAIRDIGHKMVQCAQSCAGTRRVLKEGVLPRALVFESRGRTEDSGSVMVGINPGKGGRSEHDYFLRNGINYEQFLAYWHERIRQRRYYASLRDLADQLGFSGPILWTELAMCENETPGVLPPLQTFRNCAKIYLTKELAIIPPDWPLIGAGWEAYKALAYRFPNHVVIGVPHPTGSYGHFSRLFDDHRQVLPQFKLSFDELWDGESGRAVWLDTKDSCVS